MTTFPNHVFLKIDPILQKFHFMFLDTYWSHITKFQFHMFFIDVDLILPNVPFMFSWRYWSQIADFQEFIRRIFEMCRTPALPSIFWKRCVLFWSALLDLGVSKIEHNVMGTSTKSANHAKSGVSGFSQSGIEKLLVQIEAEEFYGASGPHFFKKLQ